MGCLWWCVMKGCGSGVTLEFGDVGVKVRGGDMGVGRNVVLTGGVGLG